MGLKREQESVRPSRRRRPDRERDEGRRERRLDARADDDEDDEDEPRRHRSTRRRHRGRPPLRDEVQDLNRGGALAMAEGVALTLNIASRIMQGAVDRAFDEDYSEPGDLMRGFVREADLIGYDMVDEFRRVPRQLDRTFEEGIRSPRADRGERWRRRND
ncbi:MAG: hypothetical protein JRI23_33960 [Deltaproteobacteria bacterium]|jgi:hypothetical protein|nr:hypothetical protein [Deltaproteobacteria bacterium]MBW2537298.1 hypothetical protein [Deltaproteobacteria bacterium]